MAVSYITRVIGEGNHASFEIPDSILKKLGTNKRAPLKITINGHTYQSTATGVGGKCMVVFPQKDRQAANANAGDEIKVTLELDSGFREVDLPGELLEALNRASKLEPFNALPYSKRKEFARNVADAKTPETRDRRITKVIETLNKASI